MLLARRASGRVAGSRARSCRKKASHTAARAAARRGVCSRETARRLETLLRRYDLPTGTDIPGDALFRAALSDKKISGGRLNLIVPEAIGRCRIQPIPPEELRDWLRDGGIA